MMTHPEQISTDGAFWEGVLREALVPPLWWNWLLSRPDLRHSAASLPLSLGVHLKIVQELLGHSQIEC